MTEVQAVARWTMTAGKEDEVLAVLPELIAAVRAESGNIEFTAYRELDDPRRLAFIERYTSPETYADHRASTHIKSLVLEHIVPLLDDRVIEEFGTGG